MSAGIAIDSAHNDTYRQLVRLVESSRERRRAQRSVIEGVHLLEALLDVHERAAGGRADSIPTIHWVFVPAEVPAGHEISALLTRLQALPTPPGQTQRARQFVLAQALFRRASQVENGAGPIAVIDTPRPALPARLPGDTLYLDRVQDPGNVGSILRTAAAAGMRCVISSPGTAFNWAPKVLRAAMGAHFALDIYEGIAPEALSAALTEGLHWRALVAPEQAGGATALDEANLREPSLWLVGNEGQGLGKALCADPRVDPVTIDQCAGVESMNVAGAVAVALFEQRRQRKRAAG